MLKLLQQMGLFMQERGTRNFSSSRLAVMGVSPNSMLPLPHQLASEMKNAHSAWQCFLGWVHLP